MQASAPQKKIKEMTAAERPAPDREPSARISMRAVSALEIASVFASVIIISWAIVPLQPWRRWAFGARYDAQASDDPDDVSPPPIAALGFLVGGYDAAGVGEAWEVVLPERIVERIATTTEGGGAAWRGQSDVITRIVRGSDLELLERLADAHQLQRELHSLTPLLDACTYRIPFDSMNLQDGIDFAVLCIRTTIDVQRLTLGPVATLPEFSWPGVGGPVEIATVTAPAGFAWVQRTKVQGERPAGLAEGQGQ